MCMQPICWQPDCPSGQALVVREDDALVCAILEKWHVIVLDLRGNLVLRKQSPLLVYEGASMAGALPVLRVI
jgi:hypothetical protein